MPKGFATRISEPFLKGKALNSARRGAAMRNESNWDRAIRALLGLGLLSLMVIGPRTLWGLLGFIPLLTGISGFCPLYSAFGLSTRELRR